MCWRQERISTPVPDHVRYSDGKLGAGEAVQNSTRRVLFAELVLALILAVATSTATAASNEAAQPIGESRVSQAGRVTITVTWLNGSEEPSFWVVMDTHAVDLDGYDLAQLGVLRTDQSVEVGPTAWDAPAGGHHREGTLRFPSTTDDGALVLGADTQGVELIIRNVAGIPERKFEWVWWEEP